MRAIAGADHVRAAGPGDAVAGVATGLVIEPGTEGEVAEVLRCADDNGVAVIPRGGGTKLGWGNPPRRAGVIVSTARLDRMVEHAWADMTVTVEAGCTIAKLQQTLAEHGQRLAVDVLWPERATVGGILSTNESGALRVRWGGLRDLVIGITLALADGTLAKSGGKVVKNVAGYDLPKLATGALGTLGVITQTTFRLHPLPHATRTLTISGATAEEMQRVMLAVQDSKLAHSGLQARLSGSGMPEVDVLFEGTEAGIAAQAESVRSLASSMLVVEGSEDMWTAREQLCSEPGDTTIAKLSVLPTDLAKTVDSVSRLVGPNWSAVIQATGIGWLRAGPAVERATWEDLRSAMEGVGGSLVLIQQPPGRDRLDAWGTPGDALPLMRAVKQQFDPRGTLNPGKYVGGI